MLKYTSNRGISTGKGTNIFQKLYESVYGNRLEFCGFKQVGTGYDRERMDN